jgi:hydrogenase nickel incorporation protein HypA/HybF
MHESSLLTGLMRTVESTARTYGARRVTAVRLQLGALVQISAEHLREHLVEAARGTLAEGCRVDVDLLDDPCDARAQQVVLESVELETDAGEANGSA